MEKTLFDKYKKPTKKKPPTWEGVEVVELFQQHIDIPDKGRYGKTFWYRKIRDCGIKLHHAHKIIAIMQQRRTWLKKEKGEDMHCGKWMTNRFAEIRKMGVDCFISKNS